MCGDGSRRFLGFGFERREGRSGLAHASPLPFRPFFVRNGVRRGWYDPARPRSIRSQSPGAVSTAISAVSAAIRSVGTRARIRPGIVPRPIIRACGWDVHGCDGNHGGHHGGRHDRGYNGGIGCSNAYRDSGRRYHELGASVLCAQAQQAERRDAEDRKATKSWPHRSLLWAFAGQPRDPYPRHSYQTQGTINFRAGYS